MAGGVRLVEAELEFVAAAERLIDVVVERRVGLQARPMAHGVGGVVARDDAGRVVGERLRRSH